MGVLNSDKGDNLLIDHRYYHQRPHQPRKRIKRHGENVSSTNVFKNRGQRGKQEPANLVFLSPFLSYSILLNMYPVASWTQVRIITSCKIGMIINIRVLKQSLYKYVPLIIQITMDF